MMENGEKPSHHHLMADHPLPKGGIFRLHQSNTTGTAGEDWLCRVKHTKDDSCFTVHEWQAEDTAFQTWEKELTTNHQVLLSILLSTLHHLKEITILDLPKEESSNLGEPNQKAKKSTTPTWIATLRHPLARTAALPAPLPAPCKDFLRWMLLHCN